MLTVKRILKEAGESNLSLYKGDGYHYFVYDDGKLFVTHSVYVYRLNDLPLESWIHEAKECMKSVSSLKE